MSILDGQDQCVGQDQATFRIGVENLNSFSTEHRQDIRRSLSCARGHVLHHGQVRGDIDLGFDVGQAQNCTQNCGGTSHIGLHGFHGGGWLEGQTARIEGHALANKCDGVFGLWVGVGEFDQARWVDGPLAHTDDAAETALFELDFI